MEKFKFHPSSRKSSGGRQRRGWMGTGTNASWESGHRGDSLPEARRASGPGPGVLRGWGLTPQASVILGKEWRGQRSIRNEAG